jgi:hypothetical protein
MELNEFITNTLLSIRKGLENANKEDISSGKTIKYMIEPTAWAKERNVNVIKFDVAVVISEGKNKEGSAKINVFSVKAGGGISSSAINETTSRIQFNVGVNETIC